MVPLTKQLKVDLPALQNPSQNMWSLGCCRPGSHSHTVKAHIVILDGIPLHEHDLPLLQAALDALQQKRLPLSISELEKAISYSVAPGSELVTALKQHENVEFTSSEEFCYKVTPPSAGPPHTSGIHTHATHLFEPTGITCIMLYGCR